MDNLLLVPTVVAAAAGMAALVSAIVQLVRASRASPPPVGVPNDEQVAAMSTAARLDTITRSLRADLRQWERGRK